MSREEIIAMATEAGLNSYRIAPGEALAVWERFAALVAAKEREACATACDAIYHQFIGPAFGEVRHGVAACAAAIRESGKP